MKTLINKHDSRIRLSVPDENISIIDQSGWLVKIPDCAGLALQSFFPSNSWKIDYGNTEDGVIRDFLQTLQEVVKLRQDFKKSEIATRGKDGCK